MRTYKSSDTKVIEAQRQYLAGVESLQQQGEAFAALYPNAKPLFRTDANGREFFGLRFKPELDDPLWTKPQKQAGYVQMPRSAPIKGSKGVERRQQIEQLAELNIRYREHRPAFKADRDPVWEALGVDWGAVLMGGFQGFEQDGCYYFKTGITEGAEHWVEILSSEYDLALALHQTASTVAKAVTQQVAA